MLNLTPHVDNGLKGYRTVVLVDVISNMCLICSSMADGSCNGAPEVIAIASSNRATAFLVEMDGGKVTFAYMTDGVEIWGPLPEDTYGFFKHNGRWTFDPTRMEPKIYAQWAGEVSSN